MDGTVQSCGVCPSREGRWGHFQGQMWSDVVRVGQGEAPIPLFGEDVLASLLGVKP